MHKKLKFKQKAMRHPVGEWKALSPESHKYEFLGAGSKYVKHLISLCNANIWYELGIKSSYYLSIQTVEHYLALWNPFDNISHTKKKKEFSADIICLSGCYNYLWFETKEKK